MKELIFAHPAGEIRAPEPTVTVEDSWVRVQFEIDEPTWDFIYLNDLFQTKSRSRLPDELDGSGRGRITLVGPRVALNDPMRAPADLFEISEAMRRFPGEDEAWQGIIFGAAPIWNKALDELVGLGFRVTGEVEDEVFLVDEFGTEAHLNTFQDNQISSLVLAHPIHFEGASRDEVVRLLNETNAQFVLGTSSLDSKGYLLVRGSLPILDASTTRNMLGGLALSLIGLLQELLPPVEDLASRKITFEDAVSKLVS